MSGMPDAFVVKFNLWICKSYVNDCYCMGVKVNPTLVMACLSPLRQMSFNPFTTPVLDFTLFFKDHWWSDINTFLPFKQ